MIPFATTSITVTRDIPPTPTDPTDPIDGYSPATGTVTTPSSNVRAVIAPPSAQTVQVGGMRITYDAELYADPCDVQADDTVIGSDGQVWEVLNVQRVSAFGLDHMMAQLRTVQGASR